ncbi:MAG: MFS transporter [Candidatus Bathyarchaeia archaeon]
MTLRQRFRNANSQLRGLLLFDALDRDLKLIFVSNLLAAFGDGFVVYLLPLFIRSLNATPIDVGLLFTLSSAAAAVSIIPGGFLADKYDRKKIIVLGWALWVPIPVVFFFAYDWTQLLVPMLVYGITFSAPAVSAYTLEHACEGKMASAFTTLGAAYAIGYILSPTTAFFLSFVFDARTIFLFTAVFYLFAALTLVRISSQKPRKPETEASESVEKKPAQKISGLRKLVFVVLLFAVMMFAVSLVSSLISQFQSDIYHYDIQLIFALGTVNYVGAFLLSVAVGRIGDRLGKTAAISFSMLVFATALGIFTLSGDLGVQAVSAFLRGASFPMWAFIGVMAGTIAPAAQRARWISTVQTATRIAIIFSPVVGNVLYEVSSPAPFVLSIVVALALSVVLNLKFLRSNRRKPA